MQRPRLIPLVYPILTSVFGASLYALTGGKPPDPQNNLLSPKLKNWSPTFDEQFIWLQFFNILQLNGNKDEEYRINSMEII